MTTPQDLGDSSAALPILPGIAASPQDDAARGVSNASRELPRDPVARRRREIDEKQTLLARRLEQLGCEECLLFSPFLVAWFCGGINVRGLIAESERPCIYTNGAQRWLVCSNIDTQRFFDEELDRLGFQLKEWQWHVGRSALLGELTTGKKIASDRPFAEAVPIGDYLRGEIRPLAISERHRYRILGAVTAHAVEATARTFTQGDTEEEVAGQLAHRLLHRGIEPTTISVAGDGRGNTYRRVGSTHAKIESFCTIQATGMKDGLYVTTARTVSFDEPNGDLRAAHNAAMWFAASRRRLSLPGETLTSVMMSERSDSKETAFEYEWRLSQVGYAAGWVPAEELRRTGKDEPFLENQPIVWQARVGPAAVIDTCLVRAPESVLITTMEKWPSREVDVGTKTFAMPDILVR